MPVVSVDHVRRPRPHAVGARRVGGSTAAVGLVLGAAAVLGWGRYTGRSGARRAPTGPGRRHAVLGHAMKVVDASKAFGAVIGKALRPFGGGRGLIPITVMHR